MSNAKIPGVNLQIGGTEFTVPPLSLGDMETYGDRINQLDAMGNTERATLIIDLATASLQRNYPELTRDGVKNMIDLRSMKSVFDAVMNASEMVPKGAASGEVVAESLSTSTPSIAT